MSGFGGHMVEYRQVSIDRFDKNNLKSTAFFLSHCHRDHMIGLDQQTFLRCLKSRNDVFLYCSEVTKLLLLSEDVFKPLGPYIRVLELGAATTVTLPDSDSDEFRSVVVTALPAGHCPGSVMFLFEGKEGRALYTGDFRWEKNYATTMPALCINGHMKEIDSMYVDTTFCVPEAFYIPSRDDCLSATSSLVIDWLRQSPNHYVNISSRSKYGHEPLLAHLAKEAKTQVHISRYRVQTYEQISELRGIFTSDPSAKIHACNWKERPDRGSCLPCGYNPSKGNNNGKHESPEVLVIRPSTMWFTAEPSRLQELVVSPASGRGLHRVCYSFHSSYCELRDLVSLLRPRRVYPNVLPASDLEWGQVKARLQKFLTYQHQHHMSPAGERTAAKPLGLLKRKRTESHHSAVDLDGLVFDSPEKSKRQKQDSLEECEIQLSSQKSGASSMISPSKSDANSSYQGTDAEEDLFANSDDDEKETTTVKLNRESEDRKEAEGPKESQSVRSYVSGDEEVPEEDQVSSPQFRHLTSRDDTEQVEDLEFCLENEIGNDNLSEFGIVSGKLLQKAASCSLNGLDKSDDQGSKVIKSAEGTRSRIGKEKKPETDNILQTVNMAQEASEIVDRNPVINTDQTHHSDNKMGKKMDKQHDQPSETRFYKSGIWCKTPEETSGKDKESGKATTKYKYDELGVGMSEKTQTNSDGTVKNAGGASGQPIKGQGSRSKGHSKLAQKQRLPDERNSGGHADDETGDSNRGDTGRKDHVADLVISDSESDEKCKTTRTFTKRQHAALCMKCQHQPAQFTSMHRKMDPGPHRGIETCCQCGVHIDEDTTYKIRGKNSSNMKRIEQSQEFQSKSKNTESSSGSIQQNRVGSSIDLTLADDKNSYNQHSSAKTNGPSKTSRQQMMSARKTLCAADDADIEDNIDEEDIKKGISEVKGEISDQYKAHFLAVSEVIFVDDIENGLPDKSESRSDKMGSNSSALQAGNGNTQCPFFSQRCLINKHSHSGFGQSVQTAAKKGKISESHVGISQTKQTATTSAPVLSSHNNSPVKISDSSQHSLSPVKQTGKKSSRKGRAAHLKQTDQTNRVGDDPAKRSLVEEGTHMEDSSADCVQGSNQHNQLMDESEVEGAHNEDSDATLPPCSPDSTLPPDSPVAVHSSDSDCLITQSDIKSPRKTGQSSQSVHLRSCRSKQPSHSVHSPMLPQSSGSNKKRRTCQQSCCCHQPIHQSHRAGKYVCSTSDRNGRPKHSSVIDLTEDD